MNKKVATTTLVAALCLGLSACSNVKDAVGYTKEAPDEFAVYKRAPLSLPPEYALRPPTPGSNRPDAVTPNIRARQALLGGRAQTGNQGNTTLGEQAMLRKTGALDANPNIRQIVNQETSIYIEESKSFTDGLMFWQKKKESGTVVDAGKEAQRIRENQALGKEVTDGEVPIVQEKRKALFEGLFDLGLANGPIPASNQCDLFSRFKAERL